MELAYLQRQNRLVANLPGGSAFGADLSVYRGNFPVAPFSLDPRLVSPEDLDPVTETLGVHRNAYLSMEALQMVEVYLGPDQVT